jgi:hypothetical protein
MTHVPTTAKSARRAPIRESGAWVPPPSGSRASVMRASSESHRPPSRPLIDRLPLVRRRLDQRHARRSMSLWNAVSPRRSAAPPRRPLDQCRARRSMSLRNAVSPRRSAAPPRRRPGRRPPREQDQSFSSPPSLRQPWSPRRAQGLLDPAHQLVTSASPSPLAPVSSTRRWTRPTDLTRPPRPEGGPRFPAAAFRLQTSPSPVPAPRQDRKPPGPWAGCDDERPAVPSTSKLRPASPHRARPPRHPMWSRPLPPSRPHSDDRCGTQPRPRLPG